MFSVSVVNWHSRDNDMHEFLRRFLASRWVRLFGLSSIEIPPALGFIQPPEGAAGLKEEHEKRAEQRVTSSDKVLNNFRWVKLAQLANRMFLLVHLALTVAILIYFTLLYV